MLLLPAGPKFAGATSSFWVYTQKKKIIKILMEFELILPPNLCYTSIVTYVLWKLTVLFLSAGPIFAGDTSSFWVYTKKNRKENNQNFNGIWINTPCHALLYQHCNMYFEHLQFYFYQLDQYSLVLCHFESIQKKRKVDKFWINTTPTHFISAIEYALICI